jgi:hypothetical protein
MQNVAMINQPPKPQNLLDRIIVMNGELSNMAARLDGFVNRCGLGEQPVAVSAPGQSTPIGDTLAMQVAQLEMHAQQLRTLIERLERVA